MRKFPLWDQSRVMFCLSSEENSLPKVLCALRKVLPFTYFLGNSWEMLNSSSRVQLVSKGSKQCTSAMLDISPSRFQQKSLRAKSEVSPASMSRLDPSDTIEVRDSRCARHVRSQGYWLAFLVTFSLTFPFFPAYFSSNSSNEMLPLAIREMLWMRSCECSSNRRYFLRIAPRSATAPLHSSDSQPDSLKKGFIILAATSPFAYSSMNISSSVMRSTSLPSCLRKTSAFTISLSILVSILLHRGVLLAWRCWRQWGRVCCGLSMTAQVWTMTEQRLLACRVCESTSCTTCPQRYCLNLLSCTTNYRCCSAECAVTSRIMNSLLCCCSCPHPRNYCTPDRPCGLLPIQLILLKYAYSAILPILNSKGMPCLTLGGRIGSQLKSSMWLSLSTFIRLPLKGTKRSILIFLPKSLKLIDLQFDRILSGSMNFKKVARKTSIIDCDGQKEHILQGRRPQKEEGRTIS